MKKRIIYIILLLLLIPIDKSSGNIHDGFKVIKIPSQLITAKSAIVIDVNKSLIYAKNPEKKLPPASTTKLVTAMVVLDNLEPEHIVKISKNAASVQTVTPRLRQNEKITVNDLLHLALMRSVNSAAVALAEEVAGSEKKFAALMNKKTILIGAGNSRFANSSGLPVKGQYTTTYDLTLIMMEAVKYPLIKEILGEKSYEFQTSERTLLIVNSNKLLWSTEGMVGGKTGYTRLAKHCFVSAVESDSGSVFTAVLGASSREKLWRITQMLYGLATNQSAYLKESIQTVSYVPGKARHKRLKVKRSK